MCKSERSVEFVWETHGPGLEDNPSSVVLNWQWRRSAEAEEEAHWVLCAYLPYYSSLQAHCSSSHPTHKQRIKLYTSDDSGPSTRTDDPGPSTTIEVGSTSGKNIATSLRKAVYSTYSLRQKLEVLDYMNAHNQTAASKHFGIPRSTLQGWKGLDNLPTERAQMKHTSQEGKQVCKGAGCPLTYRADIEQSITCRVDSRSQGLATSCA